MEIFKFTKTVTRVKQGINRWLAGLLILLLLPLVVAALVLIGLVGLVSWMYNRITGNQLFPKDAGSRESEIRELICNEYFRIQLHEIESWEEASQWEDEWYEETYDEEITLYKATTEPEIEGIHHQILTTFFKEQDNGVFLQRITVSGDTYPKEIGSELIWIDYNDLKIKVVEPVGTYFLYVEKGVIKGFNKKENIEIQVSRVQP